MDIDLIDPLLMPSLPLNHPSLGAIGTTAFLFLSLSLC
nr:hypothetical protein Q903MT_gene53 [Picea sitchensis]